MSWIRSAMNKAAEVRGSSNIRAAVRTYADTVVQHAGYAVAEGAKILQDRIAARNMNNYKDAVRRLEEVSVSCKGEERVQLLRRWLVALREIERLNRGPVENEGNSSEDPQIAGDKNDSPRKPTVVLYYNPDLGGLPLNFRDVFLYSQALEGMTMSMILGAPTEEEIMLLLEIFGMCLTGGKEVHDVIVKSIQELAKAFAAYDDEVLAKREELLQFAQGAIAGLKVNADIVRIDCEVSQIRQDLNKMKLRKPSSDGNENLSEATTEVIKESVAQVRLCCRLESLLLKKRLLNNGDTPETHAHKVDKLKILSESLLSSASKTEKRISDHRLQKEEALSFRVARTSEVSQIEKDLGAEISVLEKQRDELEAELKKVKSSLAAANVRLQNAREEREQVDDASNQLLMHFKTKEDELAKAIASYRAEAETCNVFVNFLEATWAHQSSYAAQKDKQVNDELDNHEEYFVDVTKSLLSTHKDELGPAIANLRKLVENLKGCEKAIDPDEEFLQDIEKRKKLEQEYMDAETKLITIFDVVESIKEQFYSAIDNASRKGAESINELCRDIEKVKVDFESIRRPSLRIENSAQGEDTTAKERPQGGVSPSSKRALAIELKSIIAQKLVIGSPRNKPYVPLGGSSENSPVSTLKKNITKSVEHEQDKVNVREGEKSTHSGKELWKMALEFDKGNTKNTSKDEKSTGVDKELPNLKSEHEKESSVDSAESQESKKPQLSTSTGQKSIDPSDEKAKLDVEETAETKQGEKAQVSTGEGEKSVDPDEELPKSTLGVEEDEQSTEGGGWEFNELENGGKDDSLSSKK